MFSRNIFWCWPYCLLSQCAVTDSIMMLCILFISWLLFNQPVFCGHYQLDQAFTVTGLPGKPLDCWSTILPARCFSWWQILQSLVASTLPNISYLSTRRSGSRPRHSTLKIKMRCFSRRDVQDRDKIPQLGLCQQNCVPAMLRFKLV